MTGSPASRTTNAPVGRATGLSPLASILEVLAATPGLHLRAIARETGLGPSHVDYHLHHLGRDGRVLAVRDGRYRRFFLAAKAGAPTSPEERHLAGALRNRSTLAIVLCLLEKGPAGPSAVARATGRSPSTVSYHLNRLVRHGLVVAQSRRRKTYALADRVAVRAFLAKHPPAPDLADGMNRLWDQLSLGGQRRDDL